MKVFVIASNSLRRLFRDRSNIFFILVFPLLLVLILGATFGGDFEPRLGIVSTDSGQLGTELVTTIKSAEDIGVRDFADEDTLISAVERGELEAGLIVPANYDSTLVEGGDVTLEFVSRPEQTSQAIYNTVAAAVAGQGTLLRAAAFAESKGTIGFSEALDTAVQIADASPDVVVKQVVVGEPFVLEGLGQFEMGAYSELLLFIFLTSMTGSAALIQSRKLGVSLRMLSTPTSVRTILIGESLGRFAVALLQGVFIMLGCTIMFGVDWGDPLGAVAIMVVFSLGAAGTGMLIGAVFKNDQQAGSIGVVLGIGLAAFGGCMVPLAILEIFSPTLWRVAHLTPHAWGIIAFEELIIHGGTVVDILPQLGVLAAFAVVMFALGAWRLRVALTRP